VIGAHLLACTIKVRIVTYGLKLANDCFNTDNDHMNKASLLRVGAEALPTCNMEKSSMIIYSNRP